MHRGPEIVDLGAVVGVEQEHAGERRKAGARHVHARIEHGLDVEHGGLARTDGEAERSRGARAVEQRMHDDRADFRLRPLQPERLEDGKLLALRLAGVDRQPARGEPVVQALGDRAEIACAEKHRDLVVMVGSVERRVQPEAGKAEIGARLRRRHLVEREHAGRVDDAARAALAHLEDIDAVGIIEAAVKELRLERQAHAAPQRLLRHEADRAVLVVGEIF